MRIFLKTYGCSRRFAIANLYAGATVFRFSKKYGVLRMRIFLKTYGCQMNGADSEVMERLLEREGVAPINRSVLYEGADVIILKKNN